MNIILPGKVRALRQCLQGGLWLQDQVCVFLKSMHSSKVCHLISPPDRLPYGIVLYYVICCLTGAMKISSIYAINVDAITHSGNEREICKVS